jgi:glycosyltransferase involved in cell wall biosynthesis
MVKSRIIIVMVAYNAEKTLERTVRDIPGGVADEILFIDDASSDNTLEVARRLNLNIFAHGKNIGYGASQKTGYREALKRGADVVVLLHADYQYDPTKIPDLVRPIVEKRADAVFGSRMMNDGALKGGMPLWKYLVNRTSTALANRVLGAHLTEYHSGFRVYSNAALRGVPFDTYSDSFIFDGEMISNMLSKNYRITEVPIPTRYLKEASSIALWPCVLYGFGFLRILFKHIFNKVA